MRAVEGSAEREAGSRRRSGGRLPWVVVAVCVATAAVAPPAAAWNVSAEATRDDFEAFHRRLTTSVYAYPRHGAAPLGLIGFDVWAEVAVDQDFGDETFFAGAVDGDLTGDMLLVGRVGARKGLPGGIDLGISYAEAFEGDLELIGAELGWAILDGGLISPTLGLRLTGTRSVGSGAYELEQYGAELLLSKGFAVLTPYVGGGVVHSEGRLERSEGDRFVSDETRFVAYAGLTLNLILPKITVEVQRGEAVTGAVRVAFGF